jgi:hypothetical protein
MPKWDHEVRLERATEQLATLHNEITAFAESRPYTLTTGYQGQENVVQLRHYRAPPGSIGNLVSEILGALRSSLDLLAYALAIKHGPPPNPRGSSFPIVLDPMKWNESGLTQIRHVASEAQAIIERLQPYHDASPRTHALALLDSLNNVEKHRLIHGIRTVATRAELVIETATGGFISVTTASNPKGFVNQTEVARVRLSGNERDPRLPERLRLSCDVCFDEDAANGVPIYPLLAAMQQQVWTARGRLSRLLK